MLDVFNRLSPKLLDELEDFGGETLMGGFRGVRDAAVTDSTILVAHRLFRNNND